MKILHIYKSEPDTDTRELAGILSEKRETTEMRLYAGSIDYDDLVAKVFENDRVVCWW